MKRILTILIFVLAVVNVFANASIQREDPIQSIRQHSAQINGSVPRYKRVKKDLSGFSAEGGGLLAYFHGPSIMKMVATYFGESGKAAEEYYFWDGKLIFVLRTDFRYDKPLSGKVSRKTENRFYFSNHKLIKWIDENGKQVTPDTEFQAKQKEYLESSRQLSDGARAKSLTIESKQ
ncbi:MAG TPA: hypothetical protein VEM96_03175 [Pyrinomonadaceae bacterium]|nr:hypothetical protein [Pyrinomonadaceae bacterium]